MGLSEKLVVHACRYVLAGLIIQYIYLGDYANWLSIELRILPLATASHIQILGGISEAAQMEDLDLIEKRNDYLPAATAWAYFPGACTPREGQTWEPQGRPSCHVWTSFQTCLHGPARSSSIDLVKTITNLGKEISWQKIERLSSKTQSLQTASKNPGHLKWR